MHAGPGRGVEHPAHRRPRHGHGDVLDLRAPDDLEEVRRGRDAVGAEPVDRGLPGDEVAVEHPEHRVVARGLVAVAVVELHVAHAGVAHDVHVPQGVVDVEDAAQRADHDRVHLPRAAAHQDGLVGHPLGLGEAVRVAHEDDVRHAEPVEVGDPAPDLVARARLRVPVQGEPRPVRGQRLGQAALGAAALQDPERGVGEGGDGEQRARPPRTTQARPDRQRQQHGDQHEDGAPRARVRHPAGPEPCRRPHVDPRAGGCRTAPRRGRRGSSRPRPRRRRPAGRAGSQRVRPRGQHGHDRGGEHEQPTEPAEPGDGVAPPRPGRRARPGR